MSMEEYNPTEDEIKKAVESAKKDMTDMPTDEQVDKVFVETAAQMGENLDPEEPATMPEFEFIGQYEKDGWELVNIVDNSSDAESYRAEGKQTKVVAYNDKYIVFEKAEEGE